MKAIVCTKYGSADGLLLREIEKPAPKNDEVLIEVYATTVTAGDVILRRMTGPARWLFGLFFGLRKGKILGHELAGVIEAVGRDVTRFKPGDAVFASAGSGGGAYAEYICLPQDGMLALKPANLTYAQAAAVPVGANTALDILRKADIRPGQSALIYGASGSVGSYAVQLARIRGAAVTGVCSTANLAWVKALGAERVIDYTREDFTSGGETYDLIFDAVRKLPAARAQRALAENGTYLSVRSPTSETAENLLALKEWIEAGELEPVIDRRYPLERVADAHRYVETGHKRGNVVITIAREEQTARANSVRKRAEPPGNTRAPFKSNGTAVIEIEGIGPVYAKKLAAIGIKTTDVLLEAGSMPQGRETIAAKTGISLKLVTEWVHIADLMRIKGVGEEYSDLLEEAGVESVVELSKREPETLHARLLEVNRQKKLVRRAPSLNAVAGWIALARADGELHDLFERYDRNLKGGARAVRSDHTSRPQNRFSGAGMGAAMGAEMGSLARKFADALHPHKNLSESVERAAGPHDRDEVDDPKRVEAIEQAAYELGADQVGFAELRPDLVYSGKEAPYRYAIVVTMDMDKAKMATAPSIECGIDTAYVTGALGLLVNRLTDRMRELGLDAVPAPAIGGPVDYPSLAKMAGMGEFGRHGMLISPKRGACQRIAAVFTHLVLPVERSNPHAWVRDFCASCGKCIRACPCNAIREQCVPTQSGYASCVETNKCLLYLVTHLGCSICIKECPFTTIGYDRLKRSLKKRATV